MISTTQYGFRKHHSTSHAVLDVFIITKTYDSINNSKYTGLVFLHLKKVFDTVSHQILSEKLNHYGIQGQAHDLLHSSLTDRKRYPVRQRQQYHNNYILSILHIRHMGYHKGLYVWANIISDIIY